MYKTHIRVGVLLELDVPKAFNEIYQKKIPLKLKKQPQF